MSISFIYLLSDNQTPLYIGRTKRLLGRFRQHHNTMGIEASLGSAIYSIREQGRMCDLKVLALCHQKLSLGLERFFISHYREAGIPLCNKMDYVEGIHRGNKCFHKTIRQSYELCKQFYVPIEDTEKSLLFYYSETLQEKDNLVIDFTGIYTSCFYKESLADLKGDPE